MLYHHVVHLDFRGDYVGHGSNNVENHCSSVIYNKYNGYSASSGERLLYHKPSNIFIDSLYKVGKFQF